MKPQSLFKIKYLGIVFEVYKIESQKMYIQDDNGNKIGFVLTTYPFKKIKEEV